jgi:hypothetical protein
MVMVDFLKLKHNVQLNTLLQLAQQQQMKI